MFFNGGLADGGSWHQSSLEQALETELGEERVLWCKQYLLEQPDNSWFCSANVERDERDDLEIQA